MRGPSSALIALAIGGCFYMPGSYHFPVGPFAGKRVQLPCLDVAVTLTDDARATGPVVRYTFGNRCTHAATVDLGAVRVVARDADSAGHVLAPFDPRQELRPLPIDPWWAGAEEIMYQTEPGATSPTVLCIDVGAVERSPASQEHWVCLAANAVGAAS